MKEIKEEKGKQKRKKYGGRKAGTLNLPDKETRKVARKESQARYYQKKTKEIQKCWDKK